MPASTSSAGNSETTQTGKPVRSSGVSENATMSPAGNVSK